MEPTNRILPITAPTNPDASISAFDKTDLSPAQLVKHLEIYGPRDSTFPGLPSSEADYHRTGPHTHYRTTSGFIINFFTSQGVRRSKVVTDAFEFDNDRDHYQCRWDKNTRWIEITRLVGGPVTITMGTTTGSPVPVVTGV